MATKTPGQEAARGARNGNGRPAGKAAEKDGKKEKGKKEKKPKDPFADTSPMGLLKKAAAEKLGLVDKIRAQGWGGLTAAESGRVGALVNKMVKERAQAGEPTEQVPGVKGS